MLLRDRLFQPNQFTEEDNRRQRADLLKTMEPGDFIAVHASLPEQSFTSQWHLFLVEEKKGNIVTGQTSYGKYAFDASKLPIWPCPIRLAEEDVETILIRYYAQERFNAAIESLEEEDFARINNAAFGHSLIAPLNCKQAMLSELCLILEEKGFITLEDVKFTV
jgi:hypothetical protein